MTKFTKKNLEFLEKNVTMSEDGLSIQSIHCDVSSVIGNIYEVMGSVEYVQGTYGDTTVYDEPAYKATLEANNSDQHNPTDDTDIVNKPPHYSSGTIECIDAMEAMVEASQVSGHKSYLWQNCFKYLWRWPNKKMPVEDLCKCRWYLDRLIKHVELGAKDG